MQGPNQSESSQPFKVPTTLDLTVEQQQEMVRFAGEWHNLAKDCSPNKALVIGAARSLYRAAGQPDPAILWCESPAQMAAMSAILKLAALSGSDLSTNTLTDAIRQEICHPPWDRVWSKLDQLIASDSISWSIGYSLLKDITRETILSKVAMIPKLNVHRIKGELAGQFSLRAKLMFRQVFRGNTPEVAALDNPRLWREQFGSMRMETIIGDKIASDFVAHLSCDTGNRIEELCKMLPKYGFAPSGTPGVEDLFDPGPPSLPFNDPDLAPIAFALVHLPVIVPDELRSSVLDWLTLKENAFHVSCLGDICIICEAPSKVSLNLRRQLHDQNGSALQFRDGFEVFAWHGVVVPQNAIKNPETITLNQILSEQNVEVRRVLTQQYGMERYLQDAGAVQIDADDCGVLYKKLIPNDEPLVMVQVMNSTTETDGSRKIFFLRVPPHMESAKAAVAWTFNTNAQEYQPDYQT